MKMDKDGYVKAYSKEKGATLEHILVAEKALGRKLKQTEGVHHVDGDRTNNCNNNLLIFPNAEYHHLIHQRTRASDSCGDPNKRKCTLCGKWDSVENLYIPKNHNRVAVHKKCKSEYDKNRKK